MDVKIGCPGNLESLIELYEGEGCGAAIEKRLSCYSDEFVYWLGHMIGFLERDLFEKGEGK